MSDSLSDADLTAIQARNMSLADVAAGLQREHLSALEAAIIRAAVPDVPRLVAEIDRLRTYVARVEATLPMVDDLIGSAPDITGSRSTEDYMRVLRGPGPEPLPAEPSETLVQAVANAICGERHADDQARAAIAAFQKAVQGD